MTQSKKQIETANRIEELRKKIFNPRTIKKGFTEKELRELVVNDNFYQPDTIWFTKEMIEVDIPRMKKIFALERKSEGDKNV